MSRAIMVIIGMMMLTGCSELQVIGKATIRELTADTISVDGERYKARPARKRSGETQAVVASAMVGGQIVKAEQRELWRHN